jgi:hypothetical protein
MRNLIELELQDNLISDLQEVLALGDCKTLRILNVMQNEVVE